MKKATVAVQVRMPKAEYARLIGECKIRMMSQTVFIRIAIQKALDEAVLS